VPDFKPSPKFKKMVLDSMEKSGKFISNTDDEQINIFSDFNDIFKSE
jgi:hypothetical protein